jgi:hypothetical protein
MSRAELHRALGVFDFSTEKIAVLEASDGWSALQMNEDPAVLRRFAESALEPLIRSAAHG